MDWRNEVSGTERTVWLNHFMRTGFEILTEVGVGAVTEKAEADTGWLFPVGEKLIRSNITTCSPTCLTRWTTAHLLEKTVTMAIS
jgi:hypothetical protein